MKARTIGKATKIIANTLYTFENVLNLYRLCKESSLSRKPLSDEEKFVKGIAKISGQLTEISSKLDEISKQLL